MDFSNHPLILLILVTLAVAVALFRAGRQARSVALTVAANETRRAQGFSFSKVDGAEENALEAIEVTPPADYTFAAQLCRSADNYMTWGSIVFLASVFMAFLHM